MFLHSAPAGGLSFGGRFGVELEGLGEEFQSSSLFDERVLQDGTIEEVLDSAPVLSRELTTLGLIETRLDSGMERPFSILVTDVARLGAERARNSLRTETAYRAGRNRLRMDGQWDAQGGEDEPAPGTSGYLTGTWDRLALPFGLSSQLRLAADWSHTSEEDLAPILESRILRGHAEVRRTLGTDLDLRGQVGYRHKDALGSSVGSYGAWIGEAESSGRARRNDRFSLLVRAERRFYAADTLGIPSSWLGEATVRYELPPGSPIRPYTQHDLEWQDYRESSEIFQDHREWKGEIGADIFWRALRGGREMESLDPGPDVRFRAGGQYGIFRAGQTVDDSTAFESSFDGYGAIVGVAREGSDSFWFDLQVEAGRREYRNGSAGGGLVFEGLNFSLASSDYTYLQSSLVFEWAPAPWVRTEAFLQWDEELHDVDADDFRLWMVNFSVSHPF